MAWYCTLSLLLENTPAQAETLLHSLERAAAGKGLHVNAHKTEYMCFYQTGNIFTLNGSTPKLVDKFTYQGSSVSSTETNIDTRDWRRHGQLSIAFRSYGSQTWPIKWNSFSSKKRSCRYCYMNAPHGRWLNRWRKSLTAITQECCEQYWTSHGGSTPQSSSYTATYHSSWKLSKLDEPDTWDTVGEVETSSWVIYSCGPLHMDEKRQDVQLEPTYSSSVPIQDVALRICRKQWTIGRCGEKGSGISVLIARHHDDAAADDDDIHIVIKQIPTKALEN